MNARLLAGFALCSSMFGYSVLTHEAIVDSVWDTSIQKLLLKRFPNATPEDLEEAHAFTYGGCIIQDMGYYPFGSHLFSDLTHYVRSGDFIQALLRESQDLDEYAFALGALAHYAADNNGHRIAINPGVPLLYPKLEQQFGPTVTYWDDHTSHMRTEFGLDVLQVASGHCTDMVCRHQLDCFIYGGLWRNRPDGAILVTQQRFDRFIKTDLGFSERITNLHKILS